MSFETSFRCNKGPFTSFLTPHDIDFGIQGGDGGSDSGLASDEELKARDVLEAAIDR